MSKLPLFNNPNQCLLKDSTLTAMPMMKMIFTILRIISVCVMIMFAMSKSYQCAMIAFVMHQIFLNLYCRVYLFSNLIAENNVVSKKRNVAKRRSVVNVNRKRNVASVIKRRIAISVTRKKSVVIVSNLAVVIL